MGRYSPEQVRKMTPIQLWYELGLHRGLIATREVQPTVRQAESGTQGPLIYRYYSLGVQTDVGLEDRYGRRVLTVEALYKFHPHLLDSELLGGPLQGPVVVETSSPQHADAVRRVGADALRALSPGKPKFIIKNKIAHEDRPDVGAPIKIGRKLFTVRG